MNRAARPVSVGPYRKHRTNLASLAARHGVKSAIESAARRISEREMVIAMLLAERERDRRRGGSARGVHDPTP